MSTLNVICLVVALILLGLMVWDAYENWQIRRRLLRIAKQIRSVADEIGDGEVADELREAAALLMTAVQDDQQE